uniref:Midasin n=1 Tax=Heterorhabditis bacteriophora TaxID=37862 RepID=A0A1I7X675_HETBA
MYGETSEGDHDPETAGTFEVVNESQDVEEDNYSNRSPIYGSEAFREDEELAQDGSSARDDSAGDAEEPRDTNDSENAGPEEENTRDAVHSESSSAETLPAEGTEGAEAQPTSVPDRATRWRRRRSVVPPSGSGVEFLHIV